MDLSLEIMLSPPKLGTKQLYNYKRFSFMPEQVQYLYFLEAKFVNVLSKFLDLPCKVHVSD